MSRRKNTGKYLALLLCFTLPHLGFSQDIDTLIDVGNHKLHFNIWEGKGIPILFESGGGNDGSIWSHLIEPLSTVTGTTLITYDRAGMGKSEVNPALPEQEKGMILNTVKDLETGLERLGYGENLLLVSHSYGGFGSALFAARNPEKVKGVVLIDANLGCIFDEDFLKKFRGLYTPGFLDTIKSISLGAYYESLAIFETAAYMQDIEFPSHIPVIDMVAEFPPNQFNDTLDVIRRQTCHAQFVEENGNRIGITAYECGHYLFFQNPPLVIQAIVQIFANASPNTPQGDLLKRSLEYGMRSSNDSRKSEFEYWHSERDLNNWGYSLLSEDALEQALLVLKLNVLRHPESFNAYDSYGEALLRQGKKEEAIRMYQKSLELNPENENGRKVLEKLKK